MPTLPSSDTVREWAAGLLVLTLAFGVVILLLNPQTGPFWEDEVYKGAWAGVPGGAVFDMLLLLILATLGGRLVAKIGLPPLAGMLLVGFALRQARLTDGVSSLLNSRTRDVALAVIMTRAGLGLDVSKLIAQCGLTITLSTVPMIVEALTIAFVSFGAGALPLEWGLLLGFILADVSPAVTVPLLMEFDQAGYGRDKGIPSILLAASGLNSVAAIVGYGTVSSLVFSSNTAAWLPAVLGVVEIFGFGVAGGILAGLLILLVWNHMKVQTRLVALLLGATLIIQLGKKINMSGGGCLAALALAAFISYRLRKVEGGEIEAKEVSGLFGIVWTWLGQPLLFGLLGASVDMNKLSPEGIATGAYLVCAGLALRALATFTCVKVLTKWNIWEVLFSVITWCPKATVQAALAGVALDFVTLNPLTFATSPKNDSVTDAEYLDSVLNSEEYTNARDNAQLLLTTGVLSILMTAPLFAVLMWYSGRAWLKVPEEVLDTVAEEESAYGRGDLSETSNQASVLRQARAGKSVTLNLLSFAATMSTRNETDVEDMHQMDVIMTRSRPSSFAGGGYASKHGSRAPSCKLGPSRENSVRSRKVDSPRKGSQKQKGAFSLGAEANMSSEMPVVTTPL